MLWPSVAARGQPFLVCLHPSTYGATGAVRYSCALAGLNRLLGLPIAMAARRDRSLPSRSGCSKLLCSRAAFVVAALGNWQSAGHHEYAQ